MTKPRKNVTKYQKNDKIPENVTKHNKNDKTPEKSDKIPEK